MKYSTTDFLKAATVTAEHFGFRTIDNLKKNTECKNCQSGLNHSFHPKDAALDPHGGVSTSALSAFCEEKIYAINQPVLLYHIDQTNKADQLALSLNIFNVQKSIAEAILIQAARSLLNEVGISDHLVRINSLGDSESIARYVRELTMFLRKRLDAISPIAREKLKEHPLLALQQMIAEDHELVYRSPNPLEYLSDQSRKHFREIVEYLDMSEAPYEIDPKMIGHHDFYSDALFSIDQISANDDVSWPLSVRGGRFNEYLYQKTKARIPAAGVVITLKDTKPVSRVPKMKILPQTVYVVQLGFGPKMRSLMIIDSLKQAGIPVLHDLANDSLSAQLRDAEGRGVRYTIIVGQKEYVDKTVILRDMHERSQEPVTLDQLLKRLKRQVSVS